MELTTNPNPNPNPNLEEEARNWLELPKDIISMILLKLGAIEILDKAQYVCSLWRNICKDPSMWRVIDIRSYGFPPYMYFNLKKILRLAIDRSCGGLIDINLVHFGPHDFFHYITQSSNRLRRIRLECCYNIITDLGLIEAVSKLPLLEHLEIYLMGFDTETWETVGRCCPLLKTVKLNRDCFKRRRKKCEEEALAIDEDMPNSHHLQIIRHGLTNKGLQAIMDGCPDLESLDLRYCFNLNMKEQLCSECAETTKNLHFRDDPIDEYEFTVRIYDYDNDTELSYEDFIHDYQLGYVDYPSDDEDYQLGYVDYPSDDEDIYFD